MKRSLEDELAAFENELNELETNGSSDQSSYSAVPAKRPAGPVAGPFIPASHISAAAVGATVVVPPQLKNSAGVIESAPTIYKSGDERSVSALNAASSSSADSGFKTMALPSDVEMLAAKKQATKALQNSYLGQVMRGEKKMKRFVRTGGGQMWEDPSLAEWDPNDFRIFCGDLGNEVSDELLAKAFRKYPSFQKAKVVRDHRTNKSKGYGFVSFRLQDDFVSAIREMDGKYVGNRPIKLRKSQWKDRNVEVVKKKQKQKEKLGLA
uniref:RNA-binding protein 42 n=1 Tax=Steinernema glaseri TaxID=37863 RepID=A0A1I7YTA5_9BILA